MSPLSLPLLASPSPATYPGAPFSIRKKGNRKRMFSFSQLSTLNRLREGERGWVWVGREFGVLRVINLRWSRHIKSNTSPQKTRVPNQRSPSRVNLAIALVPIDSLSPQRFCPAKSPTLQIILTLSCTCSHPSQPSASPFYITTMQCNFLPLFYSSSRCQWRIRTRGD